jgi:3-hydroxybutyryl-CoA dehydrogenase
MIRTVGVAGAGTMGHGIAQSFAQAGYDAVVYDNAAQALDHALRAIARSLDKLVEKGVVTAPDRDAALARVSVADRLDALRSADFFVEAITESAEAKTGLLSAVDRIVGPDVILASNTSSIPIARLAAATLRPGRVIGMHFMNPVPLMPLVEVVRGRDTTPETV